MVVGYFIGILGRNGGQGYANQGMIGEGSTTSHLELGSHLGFLCSPCVRLTGVVVVLVLLLSLLLFFLLLLLLLLLVFVVVTAVVDFDVNFLLFFLHFARLF